jgi:hypothetical protein
MLSVTNTHLVLSVITPNNIMLSVVTPSKHTTRLERLVREKHSSLRRKFANYRGKNLYNIVNRILTAAIAHTIGH